MRARTEGCIRISKSSDYEFLSLALFLVLRDEFLTFFLYALTFCLSTKYFDRERERNRERERQRRKERDTRRQLITYYIDSVCGLKPPERLSHIRQWNQIENKEGIQRRQTFLDHRTTSEGKPCCLCRQTDDSIDATWLMLVEPRGILVGLLSWSALLHMLIHLIIRDALLRLNSKDYLLLLHLLFSVRFSMYLSYQCYLGKRNASPIFMLLLFVFQSTQTSVCQTTWIVLPLASVFRSYQTGHGCRALRVLFTFPSLTRDRAAGGLRVVYRCLIVSFSLSSS